MPDSQPGAAKPPSSSSSPQRSGSSPASSAAAASTGLNTDPTAYACKARFKKGLSGASRLSAGSAGSKPGTLTQARRAAVRTSSTRMQPVVMVCAATASAARWTERERVRRTPTAPLSACRCCTCSPVRRVPCAVTGHSRVSRAPLPVSSASSAFSSPAAPWPSPSRYPSSCGHSGAAAYRRDAA